MCLLLAQNTLDNTLQCAPCGCAAGGDRAMCTKKCKEEFTEVASLTNTITDRLAYTSLN